MTTLSAADSRRPRARVPLAVWILTVLFAFRAVTSVIGAFLFAFPLGGYVGGSLVILAGIIYALVAWRLPHADRRAWLAGLVVPIVHQVGLGAADLAREGRIPPGDYPFIAVGLLSLVLLLLPSTRRFFRSDR